jgi:hypothetical protein
MNRIFAGLAVIGGVLCLAIADGRAQSQYPIMDQVAQRVIQRYQTSSCATLAAKRAEPASPMKERVVQLLRADPAMREAFINHVAGPIANKLFECGLIP